MLHFSLTFMIFAVLAALFGFTGLAASSLGLAHLLFNLLLFTFLAAFIFRFGRTPFASRIERTLTRPQLSARG